MNVRLVRNGELPPGAVDGYCTACSGDDQRKHMGRGRCTRCAMHVKTHGLEWPNRKGKTDGK